MARRRRRCARHSSVLMVAMGSYAHPIMTDCALMWGRSVQIDADSIPLGRVLDALGLDTSSEQILIFDSPTK